MFGVCIFYVSQLSCKCGYSARQCQLDLLETKDTLRLDILVMNMVTYPGDRLLLSLREQDSCLLCHSSPPPPIFSMLAFQISPPEKYIVGEE